MKNKRIKVTTTTLCLLAVLSACSTPLQNTEIMNNSGIHSQNFKNAITGMVEFPEPASFGKRGTGGEFSTKATMSDVRNGATVALIYPPGHANANETVATGLSDNLGRFTINLGTSPSAGELFVLEATRRIGNAGDDQMSVRTYMQWTGTAWKSITSPKFRINKETTAITIIDSYDSSITASDTIDTVNNGVLSAIGTVTTSTINKVAGIVENLLTNNGDPTRFIKYQNSKYYVDREISVNKNYLVSNKYAPNSDLRNEDLSGQDLTNADLTNALLNGVNFTGTNLTGATWRSGVICQSGSIGNCILPDTRVNTFTQNNQQNPAVAMDSDGDFVITWQSWAQDGTNEGIYAQRYNSNGSVAGGEFQVNTTTDYDRINPSVAMDADGDFVVVWHASGIYGLYQGIYGQRYTSTGAVAGGEFRISEESTLTLVKAPSVAMDADGNFIVTWYSDKDGDGYGIYARRYDNTGSAQTSEFRVNSHTPNQQKNPSVAMDDDGDFVITWDSEQDGSYEGIYAQRFNSTGSVVGSEFRINTYTTNPQYAPSVAISASGDFVITWYSSGQDGSNNGIYAQRYNSSGSTIGSEFKVNTYTTNSQSNPAVAMDNDGDFIITWQSSGQDGNNYGVYAQRYTSKGILAGSEFKANTYTTDNQSNPSLAMNSDGDFVVTWKSDKQDGNGFGIYAQQYYNTGLTK